jgi:hypothetical protein
MGQILSVPVMPRVQRQEKRSTRRRPGRAQGWWFDGTKVLNQGCVDSLWHLPNVTGIV